MRLTYNHVSKSFYYKGLELIRNSSGYQVTVKNLDDSEVIKFKNLADADNWLDEYNPDSQKPDVTEKEIIEEKPPMIDDGSPMVSFHNELEKNLAVDYVDGLNSKRQKCLRVQVDEDRINLYKYPESLKIREWEPSIKLPDFDSLKCLYFDIETYSNNSMILEYFIDKVMYGQLDSEGKDKIIKEYLIYDYERVTGYKFDGDVYELLNHIDIERDRLESNEDLIYHKAGLDFELSRIAFIGVMWQDGNHEIIDCIDDEVLGLKRFFQIVTDTSLTFVTDFNGFDFDLPYIVGRCSKLRISHPFYISDRDTCFKTAVRFNRPTVYRTMYLPGDTAIIDLYHQSLSWDYTARKLTSYSLKDIPHQIGLRDKDDRVIITYQDINRCVATGETGLLKQYLIDDLKDTRLLGEFLLPDIYYQKELLPHWKLQSLSTSGFGTKWNDLLATEYKRLTNEDLEHYLDDDGNKIFDDVFQVINYLNNLTPDETKLDSSYIGGYSYQGGHTGSKPGLFINVGKVDVASQYPNTMLTWGIYSRKDILNMTLSILNYLKSQRMFYKADYKKTKNINSGRRQGSLKLWINSCYGMLGTKGIIFNDYLAAAAVTAYGRAILKKIISSVEDVGCKFCSVDTDGVYYSGDNFEHLQQGLKVAQENMPRNIELDYEVEAKAFYVPRNDAGDGLKKCYIIINKDGSVKSKGKFAKRDVSAIEKTFMPNLVSAYINGTHEDYYFDLTTKLMNQDVPVSDLSVTRKIKATEKRLVELGIGRREETVTIWKAPDKEIIGKSGKVLKKKETMWTDDPDKLDWNHYIQLVNDGYNQFIATLDTP